jgi:hypothetical protein
VSYDDLDANEQHAIRLASAALRFGMADQWKPVARAIQKISDECGGEGIGRAILGWSDTLISRQPEAAGKPVRLVFMNADTRQVDRDAADVPEPFRWAGRVIAARAAGGSVSMSWPCWR